MYEDRQLCLLLHLLIPQNISDTVHCYLPRLYCQALPPAVLPSEEAFREEGNIFRKSPVAHRPLDSYDYNFFAFSAVFKVHLHMSVLYYLAVSSFNHSSSLLYSAPFRYCALLLLLPFSSGSYVSHINSKCN